ncbi:MAG TPA: hypothetical protein VIZ30_04170 [Pseudomonadales bacterium]
MTRPSRAVGIVVLLPMLVACTAERPARIVAPTPESRAELQRVVSAALDGVAVQLADDAFVNGSLLSVEPRAFRDADGTRIMGRDLGTPTQFRLVKHGEQCIVERVDTERRLVLADTRCVAE